MKNIINECAKRLLISTNVSKWLFCQTLPTYIFPPDGLNSSLGGTVVSAKQEGDCIIEEVRLLKFLDQTFYATARGC